MSSDELTYKDKKKSNSDNNGWDQFTEYLLNNSKDSKNSKEMKDKKVIAGDSQRVSKKIKIDI